MSDLDDLAAAASGKPAGRQPAPPPRKTPSAARPPAVRLPDPDPDPEPAYDDERAYSPPPAVVGGGGVDPKVWVWLSVGLIVLLGLAFWLINRPSGGTAAPGNVAQTGDPAAASLPRPKIPATPTAAAPDLTTAPAGGIDPATAAPTAPQPATPKAATGPVGRSGFGPLEDVEEPADAIVVYHLARVATDTLEFKIRNKSKRGVYVRAMEFFAESNDRVPLGDSITFWLPPGGLVVERGREIPDMARRLGDDEGVKAVVQEAEFSDAEPEEIRQRRTAEDGSAEEEEETGDD